MAVQDSYPVPRIDTLIDCLKIFSVFSTLDAKYGYQQIELAKNDIGETPFVRLNGLKRYICMPGGLKNAQRTFHEEMDIILAQATPALERIDDIVVFSKSLEKQLCRFKFFLQLRKKADVMLKVKEGLSLSDTIDYCEDVITS